MIYFNQTNFSHGELDEKMIARTNLEVYTKAASRMRNLLVIPQGGTRRRFGTSYLQEIAGITNDELMLIPFEYDDIDKYLLVMTNLNMAIYYQDSKVADIITPYPGSILTNLELKYDSSHQKLVIVHPDYKPRELIRTNPHDTWTFNEMDLKNYPTYDFYKNYDDLNFKISEIKISSNKDLVTEVDFFTPEYVGGLFVGLSSSLADGYGVARIVSYENPKKVKVDIISVFDDSYRTFTKGLNCQLTIPIWSDTRGYPSTVVFHERRLVFGGSKSLPDTVTLSRTFDIYDFSTGKGDPDDGIIVPELGSTIKNIVSSYTLQVFTHDAEFAIINESNAPLQPGQSTLKKQGTNGSENCLPHILNNQTFYVKRGGKGVMNFVYDNSIQSYQSLEVSMLAPHLINKPIDSAIFKGSETDDANYLLLINSDGTLISYQTLLEEKISAWTLSNTLNGEFKRIVAVGNQIYFIIKRTINGSDKYYLEKIDWDVYTDCTTIHTYGVPTNVITGLEYLEGETVKVIGNGYIFNDRTVTGGEITIEHEETEVKIGLSYEPLLRTLPIALNLQKGNIAYAKKKIVSIYVDYYQSVGIYVNNVLIPFRNINEDLPYPPPEPTTDIYEHVNFGSWDARQYVEITQKDPLPMTILGIGYRLQV